VMRDAGHSVRFRDTAYCSLDEAAEMATGCDVVMLSATTLLFRDAKRLAAMVKVTHPTVPVVLGGVHPTVIGANLLDESPAIDYLCIGEGEQFVSDFLAHYGTQDLLSISGLAYRDVNGQSVANPVGPPTDLNNLPTFPYDLFDASSVVLDGPLPGFAYVGATRGCPYVCSYCCNAAYLKLYPKTYLRMRCVDLVVDELIALRDMYPAIRVLFFGDEMILFDRQYCTELFTRIHDEVGLAYGCMARVERIDKEIADLMRRTGCQYVGMGVECGDENFRRTFLNRHMTNNQIIKAFGLLRQIPGMMLASYNMHGFPVNNDDELTEKTIELNNLIQPDIVQMSTFFPFPGTRLHRHCVENDLIDPDKLAAVEDVFSQSVLTEVGR
jgi:anaerobic magnesium-protoporphyrin IX monomethyl ester cyclase